MSEQTVVCVIEDNENVRELICRALQSAGFKTVDARDGIAGTRVALKTNTAIVVTDMIMAHGDGVETILALRRSAPNVRILAMSGGGDCGGRQLLELAECAGADACLEK